MSERKHIIVEADAETGDWKYETMMFAGTVDLQVHMGQEDTDEVHHSMHYMTPEIRSHFPDKVEFDPEVDSIVAVTIKMV